MPPAIALALTHPPISLSLALSILLVSFSPFVIELMNDSPLCLRSPHHTSSSNIDASDMQTKLLGQCSLTH